MLNIGVVAIDKEHILVLKTLHKRMNMSGINDEECIVNIDRAVATVDELQRWADWNVSAASDPTHKGPNRHSSWLFKLARELTPVLLHA